MAQDDDANGVGFGPVSFPKQGVLGLGYRFNWLH
jgi:hypothetical protein